MLFAQPQPAARNRSRLGTWLWRFALLGGGFVVLMFVLGSGAQNYIRDNGGAEIVETKSKIKVLSLLLEAHKWLYKSYPTEEQGLEKLMNAGGPGRDPARVAGQLKDAWHRRIQYRVPGVHHPQGFDLFSLGPDGIEGNEDDITNW